MLLSGKNFGEESVTEPSNLRFLSPAQGAPKMFFQPAPTSLVQYANQKSDNYYPSINKNTITRCF